MSADSQELAAVKAENSLHPLYRAELRVASWKM